MAASESDIELLDMLLDGELSPQQEQQLLIRLERDAVLSVELDRLRRRRSDRVAFYQSLEGDNRLAEHLVQRLCKAPPSWKLSRLLRPLAAAAAAVLVFSMGWIAKERLQPSGSTGAAATSPAQYHVAISDETGRIVAVQKFKTLREAQEFSEDLRRWQERQEQLFSGQPTLRSASF